jgi:hypothetical protein
MVRSTLVTAWRLATSPTRHLAALGERDDRRRGARAFGVGDDGGLSTFEHGDDGVRRAEVDADCTSHVCVPPE